MDCLERALFTTHFVRDKEKDSLKGFEDCLLFIMKELDEAAPSVNNKASGPSAILAKVQLKEMRGLHPCILTCEYH